MDNQEFSYCSPKLILRQLAEKGGYGVFAVEQIEKDELLAMWGGRVVNGAEFQTLSEYARIHGIQIEEDLFLAPVTEGETADYFNHSCDPNSGMGSPISLVAMRTINAGEEVCFDYAMSDSNDYDEFVCSCGAPTCRGKVSASDWKHPDLQRRYDGYFTPYLQRRINQLKQK